MAAAANVDDVERIESIAVDDIRTGQRLATVCGLRVDAPVSVLLMRVAREAKLPCRPRLYLDGQVLAPEDPLGSIGYDPSKKLVAETFQALATASHDCTAKIWNVALGQCELTLEGHLDRVLTVEFSPSLGHLATASEDNTARLWSTLDGTCEKTFKHKDTVYCVRFSPDGRMLATTSEDKTAKVWGLKLGECRAVLRGHTVAVHSACFSEDGLSVMTVSQDAITKIWNIKSGVCERTLEGHTSVYSASYAPDGRSFAMAPGDDTVVIVSVETNEPSMVLRGHHDLVVAASFAVAQELPPPKSPTRRDSPARQSPASKTMQAPLRGSVEGAGTAEEGAEHQQPRAVTA